MSTFLREELWKQFGAGLDMLSESISMCPDLIWQTNSKFSELVYHTLFFLDYYLTKEPIGFAQPSNFSYSEFDENPESVIFSKTDLNKYLEACRDKAMNFIFTLDETEMKKRWINESSSMDFSRIEILLYNLRHVQHHVGQLNFLLRETSLNAPEWIYRTED